MCYSNHTKLILVAWLLTVFIVVQFHAVPACSVYDRRSEARTELFVKVRESVTFLQSVLDTLEILHADERDSLLQTGNSAGQKNGGCAPETKCAVQPNVSFLDMMLEKTMRSVEKSLTNLTAEIINAEMKLNNAAHMDVGAVRDQRLNNGFLALKKAVIDILEKHGLLVDAIKDSIIKTSRLKAWFIRQSPQYLQRGDLITTLQNILDSYKSAEIMLEEHSQLAFMNLRAIGTAHSQMQNHTCWGY